MQHLSVFSTLCVHCLMHTLMRSDEGPDQAQPRPQHSPVARVAATHVVSSASQAGLLKPRGAAGARADEKEVTGGGM